MTDSNPLFSPSQLEAALFSATDILQRVLVPFILLNDTARDVKYGPERLQESDAIYLGFTKQHVIPELLSTLRTFAQNKDLNYGMEDYQETEDGFEWKYQGVPIKVKVIKGKYKFLTYPDVKFFRLEEYLIPNPFDSYWKARYLVK